VPVIKPLSAGYVVIMIELQWHAARWAPGVADILMTANDRPAAVPDRVIDELRAREKGGYVALSELPRFVAHRAIPFPLSAVP
jgi:hypothetical protein